MRKLMFLLVAVALAVSVASTSSVTAAPANGAVIAKAVSADPLVEKASPVRWAGYRGSAYRPGRCNDSPAHC
jgi:hypothetical protein